MTLRLRLSLMSAAIFMAIGLAEAHFARETERRLDRLGPARLALQQKLADARKEILALAGVKAPALAGETGDRAAAPAEITPPSLFANEVVSDPHLLALYRQAARSALAARMEAYLPGLGLTPEIIARFESETVDHLVRLLELQATADANGLEMSDPDFSPLLQEETRRFQAEVSRETGLAAAQFVPLLERGGFGAEPSPVVQAVHVIEHTAATAESAPFTLEQEQQLSAIITRACPEAGVSGVFPAIDWPLIAERAQGLLAPAQIRAIQSEADREKLIGLAQQFVARRHSH